MKAIYVALFLTLLSTHANANSDYHLVLTFPEGYQVGGDTYDSLSLDINIGFAYVTANGGMTTGSLTAPATGTCFFTGSGGVFCNLQVDQNSHNLSLNSTFSGIISVKGPSGTIISSTSVELDYIF